MGKLKDEVNNIIKNSRGLNNAQSNAHNWLKTSKSVYNTNEIFKPGKIYIFRYENPLDKSKLWDMNPTVLSLGRTEGIDIGINLNFLNYTQRLFLLDKIYEQYFEHIQRSIKWSRGIPLKQAPILQLNYDNIKTQLSKTNYIKACRKYITSKRKNTKIISYNDWPRVAIINTASFNPNDPGKAYSKINDI